MKVKYYKIVAVLLTVLITFFAEKSLCGDFTKGEIIFKSKCQSCHLIEGDGNFVSTYHRQYKPKDFSKSISWEGLSEEKIKFVLTRGQGVMRAIPLNADESKALIDYMMNNLKK
jgi:hypothetical protein